MRAPDDFDPISYLNYPRWQHSILGLERISLLLRYLGDPQDELRFIHVAGTNGKGSVCAYISSILSCAGYKTGLFTSPFVYRFEERISIDGTTIPIDDLREITWSVKEGASHVENQIGSHPTEFELMCATALLYFKQRSCDIVVMEVGLGGRLDSTNVIVPEVSVITRIGLDHTAILGDTIEKIACEKAGIIKDSVPVVSCPQDFDASEVIVNRCMKTSSFLHYVDFSELYIGDIDRKNLFRKFEYRQKTYRTQLLGIYQPENAAVALECVDVLSSSGSWEIDDKHKRKGIELTKWPGRFEIIGRDPFTIMDGGHNPQGAYALRKSLESLMRDLNLMDVLDDGGITFVFGVLVDKDYRAMISAILPLAGRIYTYTPDNQRALSGVDLANAVLDVVASISCDIPETLSVKSFENARDAMKYALENEEPEGIIVAFGSLYSLAEISRANEIYRKRDIS